MSLGLLDSRSIVATQIIFYGHCCRKKNTQLLSCSSILVSALMLMNYMLTSNKRAKSLSCLKKIVELHT
uniref:Uncharacterized protein n=1 Tax=Kalanchoe fedtschenkoi TaxID=63787 RepID=A0A7N0U4T8_KALFE